MKFLFLLLICTNEFLIYKFTDARQGTYKKRNNSCFADVVSRIASDMAKKAACEAHKEGCDHPEQFSNEVCVEKQELAEKSLEAADLAQSSLAEKQAIVNKLEDEKKTIEYILQELFLSKRQLEQAIDKEMEALASGATLEEVIEKALQLAKKIAVDADLVLSDVKNNIRDIDNIIQSENKELHILSRKEHCAKADVEATRDSEKKAMQAAIKAKKNAKKSKRRELLKRGTLFD